MGHGEPLMLLSSGPRASAQPSKEEGRGDKLGALSVAQEPVPRGLRPWHMAVGPPAPVHPSLLSELSLLAHC